MPTIRQEEINASRDALLAALIQAKDRYEIGIKNAQKLSKVNEEYNNVKAEYKALSDTMNHMTKIYKNIETYLAETEQHNREELDFAIRKAGDMVPDAKMQGARLMYDGKTATVVHANGSSINDREGSALRTIMSTLMRYTIVSSKPNAIKLVIFDELFNTLSQNTSNEVRDFFDVLKDRMGVVIIEQHPIICEGLEKTVYNFKQDSEGVTHVSVER